MQIVDNFIIEREIYTRDGFSSFLAKQKETNQACMLRVADASKGINIDTWYEIYDHYQLVITNFKHLPRVQKIDMLSDDQSYAVLECRNGDSLKSIKELTNDQVDQLLDALLHLHKKNFIHGSMIPENVWITDQGSITLFGAGEKSIFIPKSTTSIKSDIGQLIGLLREYSSVNCRELEGCTTIEEIRKNLHFSQPKAGLNEKGNLELRDDETLLNNTIGVPEPVIEHHVLASVQPTPNRKNRKMIYGLVSAIIVAALFDMFFIFDNLTGKTDLEKRVNFNVVPTEVTEKSLGLDLSKYAGEWGTSSTEEGGTTLKVDVLNEESIKFDLSVIQSSPASRIANITETVTISSNGVGKFSFEDDGWFSSGKGEIELLESDQIRMTIQYTHRDENAEWNLFEGSVLFTRNEVIGDAENQSVDFYEKNSRYTVDMVDTNGKNYKVYLYSENETKTIEENTWAGANEGDTIFSGIYRLAVASNIDIREQNIQLSSFGNELTFNNANKSQVYTIPPDNSGQPTILVITQIESSSLVRANLFYISNGQLQPILTHSADNQSGYELYVAEKIKNEAPFKLKTIHFTNANSPQWGIYTWQLDVASHSLTEIDSYWADSPNAEPSSARIDFTIEDPIELRKVLDKAMETGQLGPFDIGQLDNDFETIKSKYGEPEDMSYAQCSECDATDIAHYGDYSIELWPSRVKISLHTQLGKTSLQQLIGLPNRIEQGMEEYEIYDQGNYSIAVLYEDWDLGYARISIWRD